MPDVVVGFRKGLEAHMTGLKSSYFRHIIMLGKREGNIKPVTRKG